MHEGHRERMKERFLESKGAGFADHELLELALFYCVPRADTNEMAHELLNHFGNYKGIFEADMEDLCQIKGIKKHGAIFFKVIVEMLRRYASTSVEKTGMLDSLNKIGRVFRPHFVGRTKECLYAMYLNNSLHLIDCILISEGTVNASDVSVRKITEHALKKGAATVVIAHNHPNGLPIASTADLETTDIINLACTNLGINLLEHLIITDQSFWPIMKQHCGMYRCSPLSNKVESGFFDKFYDMDEDAKECPFPPLFPL